jgi:hypothetical protein
VHGVAERVDVQSGFGQRPVVERHVETFDAADFVVTRQESATADGVSMAKQEEALDAGTPVPDTIGLLSVETSAGRTDPIATWRAGRDDDA